jgi:hypothetical protein
MNIAVVFGNKLLKAVTEDPGSPRIFLRHHTHGNLFVKSIPNENGIKIFFNNQIMTMATEKLIFDFTNNEQHIILSPGNYKIECWGAQGQANRYGGGRGAYTKGILTISDPLTLFIFVGQCQNIDRNAVYNGGGIGGMDTGPSHSGEHGGNGGGATDIRLIGGTWNNITSLRSRIMVAAGGSGGAWSMGGNPGGTLNGTGSSAPTQTSGNGFGIGGAGSNNILYSGTDYIGGGGGGGGYYGGIGGNSYPNNQAGRGGSSFISGHPGCNAVTSETSSVHTGQPNHYSGLIFTDTYMEAGVNDGHGKVVISIIN